MSRIRQYLYIPEGGKLDLIVDIYKERSMDDPYTELRAAIIEQAFIDLKEAYDTGDQRTITECEKFFRSRWFETLNPLNNVTGEDIIRQAHRHRSEKTYKTLPFTGEEDERRVRAV